MFPFFYAQAHAEEICREGGARGRAAGRGNRPYSIAQTRIGKFAAGLRTGCAAGRKILTACLFFCVCHKPLRLSGKDPVDLFALLRAELRIGKHTDVIDDLGWSGSAD